MTSIGILRASEKVRWRSTIGELNVSVSMSSEPAPYTCKGEPSASRARERGGKKGTHQTAAAELGALRLGLGRRLRARVMTSQQRSSAVRGARSGRTSTQGMPMSVRRRRHSSLCSLVTLTWRRLSLSTSSAVPACSARHQHEAGRELECPRAGGRGRTRLLGLGLVLLGLLAVREALLELQEGLEESSVHSPRAQVGRAGRTTFDLSCGGLPSKT